MLGDINSLDQGIRSTATQNNLCATLPDVYFLTANSAIPLADAIRGYYDELGKPTPELYAIMANFSTSTAYEAGSRDQFDREVKRLRHIASGVIHACVVEQYVLSGGTARYAQKLLEAAGVSYVSTIMGRWYEQANQSEVDLQTVSSNHAMFMHSIGSAAARDLSFLQEDKNAQ